MSKSSPSDYQLAHGGSKPLKLGVRAQSGEAHGLLRVRWQGRPKQLPEALFSAVFSQVCMYIETCGWKYLYNLGGKPLLKRVSNCNLAFFFIESMIEKFLR
jgi:hypothetical protein